MFSVANIVTALLCATSVLAFNARKLDVDSTGADASEATPNRCTHFYEHVCGAHSGLTSGEQATSEMYKTIVEQMETGTYRTPETPSALKKVIQFYDACKRDANDVSPDHKKFSTVLQVVKDFMNATGFNLSTTFRQHADLRSPLNNSNLAQALVTLSRMGIDTLITPTVETDWETAADYKLYLDQNTAHLSKLHYAPATWEAQFDAHVQKGVNWFNQFANLLDMTLNQEKLKTDVSELLQFEKKLATEYSSSKIQRGKFARSFNIFNVSEAKTQFQFIDPTYYIYLLVEDCKELQNYFKNLLPLEDYQIVVKEPDMIEKLDKAFLAETISSNEVINYFFFRILAKYADFLPPLLSSGGPNNAHEAQNTPAVVTPQEIQTKCATESMTYMPYASTRMFIDKIYPDEATRTRIFESVSSIIDNIKTSFGELVEGLSWMDAETKKGAKAKIDTLRHNIGYPSLITIDEKLNEYYQDVAFISNEKHGSMISKLLQFNFNTQFKNLLNNEAVDRTQFFGSPARADTWYSFEFNSITVPVALMQKPFYDEAAAPHQNYGSLGVTYAHALSHVIDDMGSQWNARGQLEGWMSQNSTVGFEAMASCVNNQYNAFCPLAHTRAQPSCINGARTQDDNLADSASIRAAWNGWMTHVASVGTEEAPASAKQSFFTSFAKTFCDTKPDNTALLDELRTGIESPLQYRVMGSLQNFPEFGKAFNCPANQVYNPTKHCSVWVD